MEAFKYDVNPNKLNDYSLEKEENSELLQNSLAAYIIYLYNDKAFIDSATFNVFKHIVGDLPKVEIYDKYYYFISEKLILEIADKTDLPKYVPGKYIKLDNKHLDNYKLNNNLFNKEQGKNHITEESYYSENSINDLDLEDYDNEKFNRFKL